MNTTIWLKNDEPPTGQLSTGIAPGDDDARPKKENRQRLDSWLTGIGLTVTLAAAAAFIWEMSHSIDRSAGVLMWLELSIYGLVIVFLIYGNLSYQLTRLGHLARLKEHVRPSSRQLEEIFAGDAPPVAFLVPSYKEEPLVVTQTLLSAALQEYPNRRVVLLIDDPQPDGDPEAAAALAAMQRIAGRLHAQMKSAASPFIQARDRFHAMSRVASPDLAGEAWKISDLYLRAAEWLDELSSAMPHRDHTDALFLEKILRIPARRHRERAGRWLEKACNRASLTHAAVEQEYGRLGALFDVEVTHFERKRYANLSHEPNKAMNLNSYIGLIGRCFREEGQGRKRLLVETDERSAELVVPAAKFLVTLDADSLLLSEYALILVSLMEAKGNERVAVAQTPYSAVPNASSLLERTAGATTDIQYLIHQGFTHHGATFWVGANAVLRLAALDEIAEDDTAAGGYPIRRFIQDRTVIEDTESTVDLIDRGWTLENFPERLAYSATPPDFGALSIQRARWANGGLIILPKLLRYMFRGTDRLHRMRECFFRVHYLTSIAGVNVGLLLILMFPFPNEFQSLWLPLTAVPYYALYTRDLWKSGYRQVPDIIRVYALNLLLLPINLGGVMRSLHQAWKKHKIPFHRTPKVEGRTQIPARYIVALILITLACFMSGVWNVLLDQVDMAAFCFINSAIFVYAIGAFIGYGNAIRDLLGGLPARPFIRAPDLLSEQTD